MAKAANKINSVIILRGIAAILVCMVHIASISSLHISKLADFLINNGQQGVPIFFIISGFILPYALYSKNYKLKEFFSFLIKRSIRIDPPYWFTIVLLFIVGYAPLSLLSFSSVIFHIFYLVPFIKGSDWYCNIFWTLSIEFQFYILLGLFYPLLNRINKNLAIIYLLTIAVIFIFIDYSNRGIIIASFYDFVIGYILFLGYTAQISRIKALIIVICFSIFIMFKISIITGTVPLLTALFIMFYNVEKNNLILKFAGNISYSLYLVHTPISFFFEKIVHSFISNAYLLFVLCFAISISFAYIFYLFIEKPAMDFSKKFRFKKTLTQGANV